VNKQHSSVRMVPKGSIVGAKPGDFMLTRRKGLVHTLIGLGERIRFRNAHWTHAALFVSPTVVVEALSHGVQYTNIACYENVEYLIVKPNLDPLDVAQACAFARSCVGEHYGFATILGIALRFLTPGRGLWFGLNGTEICSGLVAQALCRGWANFRMDPATITPAELGEFYGVGKYAPS
jgi:hypothetical protein